MHRIHSQRKLSPSAASSPSHDYAVTTITVSNQQNPSQSITTSATTLTVGRNPRSSTLCLSDPSISASHAAFNFVNNNWTISDAGSLNGTFLNKVRLEPHAPYRLSSDDVVHFGGDPSDFKVYFSSHSLDLSSTSFPRGSLSIAKSKSFCDRLNERIEEEEEARRREREEGAFLLSFCGGGGSLLSCGDRTSVVVIITVAWWGDLLVIQFIHHLTPSRSNPRRHGGVFCVVERRPNRVRRRQVRYLW